MIWKRKHESSWEIIARTGFLTSVISYLAFWMFDLMNPGFVSRYFSVHMFLLCTIIFGCWWSIVLDEYTQRPFVHMVVSVTLGLLLAVLTWRSVELLSGYKTALSFIGFVLPILSLRLLQKR